jgi:hypothetical protein
VAKSTWPLGSAAEDDGSFYGIIAGLTTRYDGNVQEK